MIFCHTKRRDYFSDGIDPSLSLGKNYIVLMFSLKTNLKMHPTMICVARDSDHQPIMVDACYFNMINGEIPPNWILEMHDSGAQTLCPIEFAGNFFEKFNDGGNKEEKIFAEVFDKLRSHHASYFPPAENPG